MVNITKTRSCPYINKFMTNTVWMSVFTGHGARVDWLMRGQVKSVLPSRELWEDNALFSGLVSSDGKISELIKMKIEQD